MIRALQLFGLLAIVDRIEEDVAVIEWEGIGITEIPASALPTGTREGDTIVFTVKRMHSSEARDTGEGAHGAASSLAAARSTPESRQTE